jgi:hypothetical protein
VARAGAILSDSKVVPFKGHFENFKALLARIAEDPGAVGFVGCILRDDGELRPVTFGVSTGETALTSVVLANLCISGSAEES